MAPTALCQLHVPEFARLTRSQEVISQKLDELKDLLSQQAQTCAGQCVKVEQIQDDMTAMRSALASMESRVAGLEKLVAEAKGAGLAARWGGRLVAGLLGGGVGAALVKFWLTGAA